MATKYAVYRPDYGYMKVEDLSIRWLENPAKATLYDTENQALEMAYYEGFSPAAYPLRIDPVEQ
jgi:hypothetical protein